MQKKSPKGNHKSTGCNTEWDSEGSAVKKLWDQIFHKKGREGNHEKYSRKFKKDFCVKF